MSLFENSRGVRVAIPRSVLTAIFDDCDQYDSVETGGRIVGTYRNGFGLRISVSGVINAGPLARRSPTSFFQDGEYQARVFRELEDQYPEIEHLGTWHTHHVNGYPSLSRGDIETYQRTVNHPNHNLDFWYALLVTAKTARPERYLVKHYLLCRDDDRVYEIPPKRVQIMEGEAVSLSLAARASRVPTVAAGGNATPPKNGVADPRQRALDDRVLRCLFPDLRPYRSTAAKCLLWKGAICLLDDSTVRVVVVESVSEGQPSYEAAIADTERQRFVGVPPFREDSPWFAVKNLERRLNRSISGLGA